jgi:transposase
VDQIEQITKQIEAYKDQIEAAAAARQAELAPLLSVPGVGTLTALTFALTVGDQHRFRKSRDVACYLGLQPKRSQSGECYPRLGSRKQAIATCARCWSSARSIFLDRTDRTVLSVVEALSLPSGAAKDRNEKLWLLSLANLQRCCITYGFRSSRIGRSLVPKRRLDEIGEALSDVS